MQLFTDEELYGPKDESAPDATHINMSPLYFSDDEQQEFKKLCKAGMAQDGALLFEGQQIEKGNVSDFLLRLLRMRYGHLLKQRAIPAGAGDSVEAQTAND